MDGFNVLILLILFIIWSVGMYRIGYKDGQDDNKPWKKHPKRLKLA